MLPDADPPARRGGYPKGAVRRQEIIDRALEVFAERGAKRTSLRAVAREVGVTHAALTHYFGSLEELLVAVYMESERDHNDLTPEPGVSPAEWMRHSVEGNRTIPGLVQLYTTLVAYALEPDNPAATAFVTDRFARLRGVIAEVVGPLQAAGRIRADVSPSHVAALVIAAADGLQTQGLLDPSVDQAGGLALLDRLLAPRDPGTVGGE